MLNHSTLLYKLYMRRAVVAVEVIRLVLVAVEVIQLVWAAGLLLVKVAALIKKHILHYTKHLKEFFDICIDSF